MKEYARLDARSRESYLVCSPDSNRPPEDVTEPDNGDLFQHLRPTIVGASLRDRLPGPHTNGTHVDHMAFRWGGSVQSQTVIRRIALRPFFCAHSMYPGISV